MNKTTSKPKGSIPLWFVRLFNSVKGWQTLYDFRCECNGIYQQYEDGSLCVPDHPIEWLWQKIQHGCSYVAFTVLHGWDRQVGQGTGETEAWGRFIDWAWNREKEGWECIDMEYNVDGFTVIPQTTSYRIGQIISKEDIERRYRERRYRFR